ncbi:MULTISPECIES: HAD family hydrolase [unclassified Streptomyces]|uniref:HAD family hydrolase n=1 Tax=unclassified Streptomyces TaxID=2593676 RepID=UPI0016607DA2|nr:MULTISPECIES: HAD family hydrolase [unclassified Streptomyces]MBD0711268.1 hydrolase [Streptomyces sp. CBMA291]MBD0716406.1 hydrolase [Streptomyces sp. CBMA370]
MAIRAVLWDVDDTLFDYARADHLGMGAHLTAEGLVDGFDSVDQALRRWRELTTLHWRRFEAGGIAFEEQRRDRVRDFLGAPGLTAAEADAWFGRYLVHYETAWTLFPDTLPVLDVLADDYRHAILSNSSIRNQDRKLRVLGIRDRFETVLCAAELGVAKPAPEAFHAACTALDLRPSEVAYVGDQPDIDARGAAEAGLRGIWLDRADTGGRPGLDRITSLRQLPSLLGGGTRFGAGSTFG